MSPRRRESGLHGILLVDKPPGMSSAGVVRDVKRSLWGAKVGHLGTLDPFATGLLPLCVGEGAKVVPFLNQEDKAYTGVLRLGTATDTLDATGDVVAEGPVPPLAREELERAAARFVGEIEQVPPMYSAIKRGGVPLYRLARQGKIVEREARRVRIDALGLEPAGEDRLAFEVSCSKGTYVRVLGAAVAEALGTFGHLESLRRTRFGVFRVEDAVPPDGVNEPGRALLSPATALPGLRELPVEPAAAGRIRLGQQDALRDLPPAEAAEEIAKLVDPEGRLVALLGADRGAWRLLRVFAAVA